MTHNKYNTAELAAYFYLLIPIIIFFSGFVRPELAIPATIYLFYCAYLLSKETRLTISSKNFLLFIYFLFLSSTLLILSGAGGFFYRNVDWVKHFAMLNHLIDNHWPTIITTPNGETGTLRYTIGWYLPSALALKIGEWPIQDLALSLWSATGLVIFFFLLSELIPSKRSWILAPILFSIFSGMDFLGGEIFRWFSRPIDIAWWHGAHLEWWSGWMSYSSIISLIFWTPQHAISGWIATALIMRQYQTGNNLHYLALILSCVMLTSAFTVIGLLPFAIVLILRFGIRKIIFHWSSFLAVLLVAIPLTSYLTAFTADIPHGFIWNKYCSPTAIGCFSIKSYLLVMLMEVIPFFSLLYIAEKQWRSFTAAAGLFLLLLPLVHMGLYNDIVMRASIPAIAYMAILSAKVVLDKKPYISSLLFILLIIGSFTGAGEIVRAITWKNTLSDQTSFDDMADLPTLYQQYFAPNKIWILDPQ